MTWRLAALAHRQDAALSAESSDLQVLSDSLVLGEKMFTPMAQGLMQRLIEPRNQVEARRRLSPAGVFLNHPSFPLKQCSAFLTFWSPASGGLMEASRNISGDGRNWDPGAEIVPASQTGCM